MDDRRYNLAIETSSGYGSVSLGRGDQWVGSLDFTGSGRAGPVPNGPRPDKNRLDLMPAIDRLTCLHHVDRSQIAQVYLSIGPGSFTGLRVAVVTAKTMAMVLNVKLVAVPTTDVVAQHVLKKATQTTGFEHLAVCLNTKQKTAYAQLFDLDDRHWQRRGPASVQPIEVLLETAPRPLTIVTTAGVWPDVALGPNVTHLCDQPVIAHSDDVWQLGRAMAQEGCFADPRTLLPLYARPPEAQQLWDQRHRLAAGSPSTATPATASTLL